MIQIIPLLTSVFTIIGMWLAGNKDHRAWYVGIGNQALWLTFIITFQAWGLLPLLVVLLFVYSRNLIRWKRENNVLEDQATHQTAATARTAQAGIHPGSDRRVRGSYRRSMGRTTQRFPVRRAGWDGGRDWD